MEVREMQSLGRTKRRKLYEMLENRVRDSITKIFVVRAKHGGKKEMALVANQVRIITWAKVEKPCLYMERKGREWIPDMINEIFRKYYIEH